MKRKAKLDKAPADPMKQAKLDMQKTTDAIYGLAEWFDLQHLSIDQQDKLLLMVKLAYCRGIQEEEINQHHYHQLMMKPVEDGNG